jgi:hypothetical protein
MRFAQVLSDSLRRSLATARSAPSCSSALSVDGGICLRAVDAFVITYSLSKYDISVNYMCILLPLSLSMSPRLARQNNSSKAAGLNNDVAAGSSPERPTIWHPQPARHFTFQ